MRVTLLVTVPAIFWIGLFGLLGAWRLGQLGQGFLVMSFQQAITLIVSGLLLLIARVWPVSQRACSVFVIALTAAMAVAGALFPSWGSQRPGLAALGLALAFGSGCLMLLVRLSKKPLGFRPNRHVLLTAVIGTFFSVAAAYLLIERDVQAARSVAQIRSEQLRDEVLRSVRAPMGALDRLGHRWSAVEHPVVMTFAGQEFKSLLASFKELKRLTYLDASLRVLHDSISDDQYANVFDAIAATPQDATEILKKAESARRVYLKPLSLTVGQAPVGLIIVPIYQGNRPERFVVATVNIKELVSDNFRQPTVECCFEITHQQQVLHETPLNADSDFLAIGKSYVSVQPDLDFGLNYWHTNDANGLQQAFLPEGILLFGLAFTFLANSSQRLTHVVKRGNSQLQYRALHDALTGLPNRRMLADSMAAARELCARDGSSVSVIFLELDGLRLISDTLGHEVSDVLLQVCASRMVAELPKHATLAHLGAGSFVVCVTGQTDHDIEVLTRCLLDVVQEPVVIDPHYLRATACAGVTRSTRADIEPMQLVRQADMAMLEARRKGHRRWYHYRPDLGEKVQTKLALYNDLQHAIEKETIQLHYQPIVDGHSGAVAVFEVLMRQPHRERGLVPPSVFIPLAEESGQIMPLTDWLLRQVCKDAKVLEAAGFGHIPLAVNISARYFQAPNFVEKVRDVLVQNHIAPSRLHLEITESVLLEEISSVIFKLQQLRALGVHAGLDDFGTGYSSLAYLRDLPISIVKIDRVFVKNVISEPADAAIVRAVCTMAHHMRLKVVVEGVETAAQLTFLRRLSCDLFQGYLFDRPKPLSEVISRLQETGGVRALPEWPKHHADAGILLVGDAYWTAALAFGLEQADIEVACAMSAKDAFTYLAQHDCKAILVQDGVRAISAESLLSKVADIYPTIARWIAQPKDEVSGTLETMPGQLVQRVWMAHPQAMAIARAVMALSRQV